MRCIRVVLSSLFTHISVHGGNPGRVICFNWYMASNVAPSKHVCSSHHTSGTCSDPILKITNHNAPSNCRHHFACLTGIWSELSLLELTLTLPVPMFMLALRGTLSLTVEGRNGNKCNNAPPHTPSTGWLCRPSSSFKHASECQTMPGQHYCNTGEPLLHTGGRKTGDHNAVLLTHKSSGQLSWHLYLE